MSPASLPSDPERRYAHVAVVIPALDEERALPLTLAELPPVGHRIVVDNGSRDATAQRAREAGATVVAEPRRGYGRACQAGIAEAHRRGAEVIVFLDADHSDHPAELPLLVEPILRGEADLVLGDRTARAARGALLPQQRVGNALASFLIERTTGRRFRDLGPFRAIRAEALRALCMVDPTFGWNVEMQLKALRHGLRVQEVPVSYRPRVGDSKISGTVRGSLRAGARILWACRRYA